MMKNKFASLSFLITLFSSSVFCQENPLNISRNHFIEKNMNMDYTINQKPSIHLVGIVCRTSNAPEAGPHDIPKHWERFYREGIIAQIPNKISNEVIALYCDYEGDYTQPYSLVLGCPVNSLEKIPKGMIGKVIPRGTYAVFRAIGEHPKSVIETWGNIWGQTDLVRTYTGDYEVYGDQFFSGSPPEVNVFVAVKQEPIPNEMK
jgi:predicted transcriptional regulator YdeE